MPVRSCVGIPFPLLPIHAHVDSCTCIGWYLKPAGRYIRARISTYTYVHATVLIPDTYEIELRLV